MKNITLLVMAAGMGSRYGGLKQLDGVGPHDETIIDYSVYDAIKAGFNKVVFIIRKEFENEFKSQITDKYENQIEVQFSFQDIENLPSGFLCPKNRKKPWGTAHARFRQPAGRTAPHRNTPQHPHSNRQELPLRSP